MEILYEDNQLIAVNKTNHELAQGDSSGDMSLDSLLKEYIKKKYGKPGNVFLGVVHRLDRPVSGIILYARTSKALARLNTLFREGNVRKTYWAIVKNKPSADSGTIRSYLTRNPKQNKSYSSTVPVTGSKESILEYTLIASSSRYHLLEVDLKTGRHHQIRAQLSELGCPVKGDLKYGFPRSNPDGGISLHARKLEFEHPVGKYPLTLKAAPPQEENLWKIFLDQLNAKS